MNDLDALIVIFTLNKIESFLSRGTLFGVMRNLFFELSQFFLDSVAILLLKNEVLIGIGEYHGLKVGGDGHFGQLGGCLGKVKRTTGCKVSVDFPSRFLVVRSAKICNVFEEVENHYLVYDFGLAGDIALVYLV